jgi:hypothetical protein
MRSFLAICILCSFVSFSACKKNISSDTATVSKKKPFMDLLDGISNGQIVMEAIRYQSGNSLATYSAGANVFSDTAQTTPIDVGTIGIGPTYTMTSNSLYGFQYGFGAITGSDTTKAQACFGASTTFSGTGNSGNGVNAFSQSFYVPKEMILLSPANGNISISSSFPLTWNSDGSNSNGVYIYIHYDGTINHAMNSALPSTDVWISKSGTVTDNGSNSFSSGDLGTLPLGGIVQVIVARGSASGVTTNNSLFIGMYGYTMAMQSFTVTS